MKRDDVIEYSLDTHHSDEEGARIRKKIWIVTGILTIVTIFEVILGVFATGLIGFSWQIVKLTFIGLTILKAAYIVLEFMHLGNERRNFKWIVLAPYIFFILYIVSIILYEGVALYDMRVLLPEFWR